MTDLSQLEERLSAIEMRLSLIENHLSGVTGSPWAETETPTTAPILPPTQTEKSQSVVKPGNWLGLIAIVCFLFA
ncbi:hypothetical protein, partial [Legionella tunisiensis]|uniref:hypothetical protein n=1 Tax=Legionella tunisiensis TaxID=1034944 RepID=UPI000592CB48